MRFFTHKELKSLFQPLDEASQNSTQDLMAQQLGSSALEHGELLDRVQQDVGSPDDEEASFWRSTDILGFSDYQKLFTKLEEVNRGEDGEDEVNALHLAQAMVERLK